MTAPALIDIDPSGRDELVVAVIAADAVAEATHRSARWAAGMTVADVNRHQRQPEGASVIVVLRTPADGPLVGAVQTRWGCVSGIVRLDERRWSHAS